MPSGGNTPLSGKDWELIRADFDEAKKNGLQYEWLQFFIGGLVHDNRPVREASYYACVEWDF
jgi:hypothetical protein